MNDILTDDLPLNLPITNSSIIKIIGVGGSGGNAINHMYRQGINDVTFVACNTDEQDLKKSLAQIKIQLGNSTRGLGAGNKPEVGRQAAEERREEIKEMLSEDDTRMVFITAGMGGGTGTGASPVIAEIAQELGILTVAIVTIPFLFEREQKIHNALEGVASLSRYVDAILVINNQKLFTIYPELDLTNAFSKADDILSNAAKAVAEIITITGYINIDFADVNTIMRQGKVAIMNTGYASGEDRVTKAIEDALNSPLLNTNDVQGAKKILLSFYSSKQNAIQVPELEQIENFMKKFDDDVTLIWGATFDDELGDEIKVTLIATGFDVKNIPGMPNIVIEKYDLTGENIDEEDEKEKNLEISKAMHEIYGDDIKSQPKQKEISIENLTAQNSDIEEVDIEDLEEYPDHDFKEVENVPAWKRKLFGK